MPTPTPLPSLDPIVQLRFTGLLVFTQAAPNQPMIIKAVKAGGHTLRVMWVKKIRGTGSTLQLIPLPENTGFTLTVTNPTTGHGGVEKHLGGNTMPDPMAEPNAYHHLLNFKGLTGNSGATPKGGEFHNDIIIRTGYFYSADNYGVKIGPGEDCSNHPPKDVSFMMGANLYFDASTAAGGKATITVPGADPLETEAKKATDPDFVYELHITNLPSLTGIKAGNHFRHYYGAFNNTPTSSASQVLVCPKDMPLEDAAIARKASVTSGRINYMHPCIPVGG